MHSQDSCGCWQLCSGKPGESQVQQGLCSAQHAPGLPCPMRKYQCPDPLRSLCSRKIRSMTLAIGAPRLGRSRLFSVQKYLNKGKRQTEFYPVSYLLHFECWPMRQLSVWKKGHLFLTFTKVPCGLMLTPSGERHPLKFLQVGQMRGRQSTSFS